MREPDFYLSADMRLIELQRSALGLEAPERPDWENRAIADGPTVPEAPLAQPAGAVVHVLATATPSEGVIPGAIVTLTLSVANEGVAPARDVVVAVPLPGGATYRLGSFVKDGAPAFDELAERFFGAGLSLGDLAPKSRATFVWKIGVRIGAKPLIVAPQVAVAEGAALGAKPLAIGRKDAAATALAAEAALPAPAAVPHIPTEIVAADLPFYELDADEARALAAEMAPEPEAAPPEPPPQEPVPEPVPPPAPARQGVALLGTFDRPTLAFFVRSFRGARPATILQHCIFGSALACTRAYADGSDAAGLREHFDAQSQILHRIALHEKLGRKEPIAEYAGALRARIDALAPEALGVPGILTDSARIVFEAELGEPTLAVLRSIEADAGRWDFVKARQLTLALQAQRIAGGTATDAQRARVENALRAYAQTAMTTLQKLFVRIRIDRTTGVLGQTDAELDRRAVELLEALAPLLS